MYIKLANIKDETKVQPGLSLSPSDIEQMTARGQSASLGSLEQNAFYDDLPLGADVPIEFRRGVTLNTVWEHSKDAEHKILTARSEVVKALNEQKKEYN